VPPLLLPLQEFPPDSVLGVGSIASACGPRGPPAPLPVRTVQVAPLRSRLPSAPARAFPSVRPSRARSTRAAVVGPRLSRSSLLTLAGSALSWNLGLFRSSLRGCFVPRSSGLPLGSVLRGASFGSLPVGREIPPSKLGFLSLHSSSLERKCGPGRSAASARPPCVGSASASALLGPSQRPCPRELVRSVALEVSLVSWSGSWPFGSRRFLALPQVDTGFTPLPASVAVYR